MATATATTPTLRCQHGTRGYRSTCGKPAKAFTEAQRYYASETPRTWLAACGVHLRSAERWRTEVRPLDDEGALHDRAVHAAWAARRDEADRCAAAEKRAANEAKWSEAARVEYATAWLNGTEQVRSWRDDAERTVYVARAADGSDKTSAEVTDRYGTPRIETSGVRQVLTPAGARAVAAMLLAAADAAEGGAQR